MGKLSVSLIIVVVVGVVSLGWGISRYYSTYMDKTLEQNDPEILMYQQMGAALANTITVDNQAQLIQEWNLSEELNFSLVHQEELALPNSLLVSLSSGNSVALESKDHLSLHFKTTMSDVFLVLDIQTMHDEEENSLRLILTLGFYFGIIAIVSLWLYPLIRRLQRLRKTAIEFGSGELSARIHTSRYSYIYDIEREFNRMADRIHSLVDDNKLLSRAVSHDLKTPLARLRFGFETLSETESLTQQQKYHARIASDLDEMEALVETLLQYARIDEGNIAFRKELFALDQLVEKVVDSFVNERVISINVTGSGKVEGDTKYLRMLIHNLILNASEYGERHVHVSIEETDHSVILRVEDDGVGIPADTRAHIIKPFVKGSEAKSSGKKGHGMGLAIVQRIAEWHRAELVIDDSPKLEGARLSIIFPRLSA